MDLIVTSAYLFKHKIIQHIYFKLVLIQMSASSPISATLLSQTDSF